MLELAEMVEADSSKGGGVEREEDKENPIMGGRGWVRAEMWEMGQTQLNGLSTTGGRNLGNPTPPMNNELRSDLKGCIHITMKREPLLPQN